MREHDWERVRRRCHLLLRDALERLTALTGLPPVYPHERAYQQMAVSPLPALKDAARFKTRLYEDYRIEIPLTEHRGQQFLRLSVQGYTSAEDLSALAEALAQLLSRRAGLIVRA